jgi:phosphate-selective porin OprO/OprP
MEMGMALLLVVFAAAPMRAAEEPDKQALEGRLDALEQELAVVRRQLEVKQEEDTRDKDRSGVLTADSQGFQLRSRDQKTYRLRLRGYVQSDGRFFLENDEGNANDTFLIRRARPIFEGTLFEVVDFRIMPDFGGSGTSSSATATIQDAWLNYRPWSFAQLQPGKFKSPMGLERLQSATALTFIERAFPTQIAPNRDIGLQFQGELREGFAQYQFAVMNGVLDGGSSDSDSNDAFDLLGRVFVHPFQETAIEPLQGLGIGAAVSYGRQDGANGSTPQYRTPGQQTFFSYVAGVSEVDDRVRIAPQAYWYWGPLGAMAEWTRATPNLRLAGEEISPDVDAWQVTASWVVTGENRTFQGVVPRSPFNPAREARAGEPGSWRRAPPASASTRTSSTRATRTRPPRRRRPSSGASASTGTSTRS